MDVFLTFTHEMSVYMYVSDQGHSTNQEFNTESELNFLKDGHCYSKNPFKCSLEMFLLTVMPMI